MKCMYCAILGCIRRRNFQNYVQLIHYTDNPICQISIKIDKLLLHERLTIILDMHTDKLGINVKGMGKRRRNRNKKTFGPILNTDMSMQHNHPPPPPLNPIHGPYCMSKLIQLDPFKYLTYKFL